ncbi:hypothetical protein FJ944_15750 [Mesorhizobium sp. B2-4-11]|nr:hypothetical protein FJ944_15750 [Mesorhizobium sp. B2-4-11]
MERPRLGPERFGLAWLGLAWLGLAWLGLDLFLTLGVGFGYLRARDEGSQMSGRPSVGYKNSPG